MAGGDESDWVGLMGFHLCEESEDFRDAAVLFVDVIF